jgi:hypothetical protein
MAAVGAVQVWRPGNTEHFKLDRLNLPCEAAFGVMVR